MNFYAKTEVVRHDDTAQGGYVWYEARGEVNVPAELTGASPRRITASGDGALERWAKRNLEIALKEKVLASLKINISLEGETYAVQS